MRDKWTDYFERIRKDAVPNPDNTLSATQYSLIEHEDVLNLLLLARKKRMCLWFWRTAQFRLPDGEGPLLKQHHSEEVPGKA